MNLEEDFSNLNLCLVNGHYLLPPRFTDIFRHSRIERFNPVGEVGAIAGRFNYYLNKLARNKTWKDVTEEVMDGVVSIVEMRQMLDTYYKTVKDVVDGHGNYVDMMAVFTFYFHFFVDNTRIRHIIFQYAIDGISSASIHRLYICAENIKRALPPHINFFRRDLNDLNEVGVGFQYAGIEKADFEAKIPDRKVFVLANEFPADSASDAGDDTESDICTSKVLESQHSSEEEG